MTLFRLLCVGLVIHLVFLFSIFDIYFKSPILTGIPPEPNHVNPMGKRVVVISVDGLRLDSLFDKDKETGKHVAEYVLNVIKNRGSWGVSQSRVPTESRPGHVAMLAGFYEDPSAVTRGWKENPVDFDSIFNRSHCSFAWGSPDILNIFFKGLKHNCAFMESYTNEQNFAGDTREYDNWVYDKLIEFMKFSKQSMSLYDEGIFFFLHLLGQDTSGHTDKPHTKKYRENLRNVDRLVEKIENAFYEFYGDDRTTYIFTSDHGMTDWGSHGAGDFEETNTPFVAWGAGIKKPTNPPRQINISQADITPLLAVLLGSPIPVNSIGTLPILYLNMSKKQIAEALFLNARQITSQYLKALENTEKQIIKWFHIPFRRLPPDELSLRIWSINDAIKSEKYTEAISNSKDLIDSSLDGLNYYQNYYQKPLLICISLGYIGWMLYLLLELFDTGQFGKYCVTPKLNFMFCCVVSVTVLLIIVQKLPVSFYVYFVIPELVWYFALKKVWYLQAVIESMDKLKCMYFFMSVMIGVEVLVVSFFYRWCLCISVGMILFSTIRLVNFKLNKTLMVVWLLSGVALSFFSLLPVIGGQPNPPLTALSGLALCFLYFSIVWFGSKTNLPVSTLRFLALALSVWNSYSVHSHFNNSQELLGVNQYISWFLLIATIPLLLVGDTLLEKLFQVFITLSIPFILLSISHEGFFLLCLFVHLFSWMFVESLPKNQDPTVSEFRLAYVFLAYIFLSFFGLGNTSSLNSFDPAWVRCFLTVFSPFLMSGLILLKTVIPFLVVTCTMRVMTVLLKIQPGRLFIIVLIYCNLMGLNFLFLVKNKGSWLDIGTSISHYVIQQVTIVFLVLLFGISKVLTTYTFNSKRKTFKEAKLPERFSLPTFYNSNKQHGS